MTDESLKASQLIHDLEQANSQLIQSEKLAAIGQLAAGVAHEINNPIGYVYSNLKTLEGYIQDLLAMVDSAADHPALETLKQERDYAFLREDVSELIQESREGIERVRAIIASLKDFSHIEEETFRAADLQHCLESTLNLVNNEIKYKAEVVTEFLELPPVECLPSQINQVILNLLTNAGHAIGPRGTITLRTGVEAATVWFEVEDTGYGIKPEHMSRLFEPFFTTKRVGEGTGLGLSLSYSIVEKHGGRIEAFSEEGRGCRFRVWLPVEQPASSQKESTAP
ncbi:hypothetical protein BWR19_18530 [Halomonas sp. 1513]|nr:hypothetical protein BWR19_18530 [Halomonas sp. 1513]